MHALIIEDESFTALLIEDHLGRLGYTSFAFATTQEEAMAAANRQCPDLISSDVHLLQGCGIAAVEAICGTRQIPVIFITASAPEARKRRPDAIIVTKPFVAGDLARAVTASAAAVASACQGDGF
jgi:CheY-like chemotaxis protein